MAVVVISREMLVTTIRCRMEQHGIVISANVADNINMVLQGIAISLRLLCMGDTGEWRTYWMQQNWDVAIWLAIISTIYSGVGYIIRAARMVRGDS